MRKFFSLTETNHVFIMSCSISNTTVFYLEAGLPHPKLRAYKSIWWLIDARNFGYDVSARRPARPAIHTLIKEKRRLCRGGTGSPRHESLCKPWRNVSHFKGKHGIFMSYLFVLWLLNNTNTNTSNPCVNSVTCIDLHLNFSCICQTGFTGNNCSQSKFTG